MNDIRVIDNQTLMALGVTEAVFSALQNSIYPGASIDSIILVVKRCKASGLDPLMKPFHIVPMSFKNDMGQWGMRDVIMPGIGLYRITAVRTKQYCGSSAPTFGPMITQNLDGSEVTFPEWCEVTVYKLVAGVKCEFTAREYWLENYATQSKKTMAPNNTWRKRVRGQLAKCAEAQALRKAFPEDIPQEPTFEEMEGKTYDNNVVDNEPQPQEAQAGVDGMNRRLGIIHNDEVQEKVAHPKVQELKDNLGLNAMSALAEDDPLTKARIEKIKELCGKILDLDPFIGQEAWYQKALSAENLPVDNQIKCLEVLQEKLKALEELG